MYIHKELNMKLRKLLMLFPAVLALSACGKRETEPEAKSVTDSAVMAENFKKIGEDMAYIAASKTKPTKSLQPMSEDDKKIELVMPSVMTYLVGKLYYLLFFSYMIRRPSSVREGS